MNGKEEESPLPAPPQIRVSDLAGGQQQQQQQQQQHKYQDQQQPEEPIMVDVSEIENSMKSYLEKVLHEHTNNLTHYFQAKLKKQSIHLAYHQKRHISRQNKEHNQTKALLDRQSRRAARFAQLLESEKKITHTQKAKIEEFDRTVRKLREERSQLVDAYRSNIKRLENKVASLTYKEEHDLDVDPEEVIRKLKQEAKAQQNKIDKVERNNEVLKNKVRLGKEHLAKQEREAREMKADLEQQVTSLQSLVTERNDEITRLKHHNTYLSQEASKVPALQEQVKILSQRLFRSRQKEKTLEKEKEELKLDLEEKYAQKDASFRSVRKRLIVKSFWFRTQIMRLKNLYKLAMNMDTFLSPETTCKFCLDVFEFPQVLACGHSLCTKCVDKRTVNNQVECLECKRTSDTLTYPNLNLDGICSRFSWWHSTLAEIRTQEKFLDMKDKDN